MKDKLYNELLETNAQPSNLHPVFLAQKDEISFALSKGYSRKTIWKNLRSKNKFGGCYITFCTYVTRYITHKNITKAPRLQPSKKQTPSSTTKPERSFDWSPNYDPKDLY